MIFAVGFKKWNRIHKFHVFPQSVIFPAASWISAWGHIYYCLWAQRVVRQRVTQPAACAWKQNKTRAASPVRYHRAEADRVKKAMRSDQVSYHALEPASSEMFRSHRKVKQGTPAAVLSVKTGDMTFCCDNDEDILQWMKSTFNFYVYKKQSRCSFPTM